MVPPHRTHQPYGLYTACARLVAVLQHDGRTVEVSGDYQEVKDERVKTLRLLMADSVLRNTCQLPRPGGERNNYRYSSILASGTTEHTFETDYKLMIYMVQ